MSKKLAQSEQVMWNVLERFSPKAIEGLAALGFSVGSTRGVVRVEKYGCGAEVRRGPDERYQMTIAPTIMLKGQFTRLWERRLSEVPADRRWVKDSRAGVPPTESAEVQRGTAHGAGCADLLQRSARFGQPTERL